MNVRKQITTNTPDRKGADSASKVQEPEFSRSIASPVDHILHLQRTIGNQAVQRLVKSGVIQAKLRIGKPNDVYEQEADRVAEQVMHMPEPQNSIINDQLSIINYQRNENIKEDREIQTKPIAKQITPLIQREDEPEEEEELIQTSVGSEQNSPLMQRQVEEEEEEEPIQAKGNSSSTAVTTPGIESSINSLRGAGQSLPESVRSYFELRFGYDFSQVRGTHEGDVVENVHFFDLDAIL